MIEFLILDLIFRTGVGGNYGLNAIKAGVTFSYSFVGLVPAGVSIRHNLIIVNANVPPDTYTITVRATNTANSAETKDATFRVQVLDAEVSASNNKYTKNLTADSDKIYTLDQDAGIFAYNASTRRSVSVDRWTASQVPTNAIAFTRDGEHVWFLIKSPTAELDTVPTRVEKWVWATKAKVNAAGFDLQAGDRVDAIDIHATNTHILVIKKDSPLIRAYAKELTVTTRSVSTATRIPVAGFLGNAPDYISPAVGGFIAGVHTSNGAYNYFYVPKSGTNVKSLFATTSRDTTSSETSPAMRGSLVTTLRTTETYTTTSLAIATARGLRTSTYPSGTYDRVATSEVVTGQTTSRGSLVTTLRTSSNSYTSAATARSAAETLAGNTYSSTNYQWDTSATSRVVQAGARGSLVGSWNTSRTTYLTASAARAGASSIGVQTYPSASYEHVTSATSRAYEAVTVAQYNQTHSNYRTQAAAQAAGDSIAAGLRRQYPGPVWGTQVTVRSYTLPGGGVQPTRWRVTIITANILPVTLYTGVKTIYNKLPGGTFYQGVATVYRTVTATTTRYRGILTVYNRVSQSYTRYTRELQKFFQSSDENRLIKINTMFEGSSIQEAGRFDFDIKGTRGAGINSGGALDVAKFNALTADTDLFSREVIDNKRGGARPAEFTNDYYSTLLVQPNLAVSPTTDEGAIWMPVIVSTATAVTSIKYSLFHIDFNTGDITEDTAFANRYNAYPNFNALPGINQTKDMAWQGTDSDFYKNLYIRSGSVVLNFTSNAPVTTNQQTLAMYPTSGGLPGEGSGFVFNSTTDWAAGYAGGIYSVGPSTVTTRTREIKQAYMETGVTYKNIGGNGTTGRVVALTTANKIQTFTQAMGVLTKSISCATLETESANLKANTFGVTEISGDIYIGRRNPPKISVVQTSDCTFVPSKEIGSSIAAPTDVLVPTLSISNKTAIIGSFPLNGIELEQAESGEGNYTYEITERPNTLISLVNRDNKGFLILDSSLALGRYALRVRASRTGTRATVTAAFTLIVQDPAGFTCTQPNLMFSFAPSITDADFELDPIYLGDEDIGRFASRLLGAAVEYVSGPSGNAATTNDWSFAGNDRSQSTWFQNRNFKLKSSMPDGVHTFRYRAVENLQDNPSYARGAQFENVADPSSVFTFTVQKQALNTTPTLVQSDIRYKTGSGNISFVLNPAAGGQTGVFRYALTGIPNGASFDPSTRTLSLTNTLVVGETDMTYTATVRNAADDTDLSATVTETVKLIVTEYDAPSLAQGDINVAIGAATREVPLLLATGGTGRYDYEITGLPNGVVYIEPTHSLLVDPTANPGESTITLTAQSIDNRRNLLGTKATKTFNLTLLAGVRARVNYAYAAVYKWIDGNGLEHFSGTDRKNITLLNRVGTLIDGAPTGVTITVDKIRTTLKRPVFLEIYRSQANLSSLVKLVRLQIADDGDDLITYTDTTPDNLIAGRELLYSDVVIGENIQPESATTMQIFSNHIVIAGMTGDRRRVLISKRFDPAIHRPVEFDGLSSFTLPEDIVSLKRLDNRCVIFTEKRIFLFDVLNFENADPTEIQTSFGIVPDSKNAIVRTTNGLIFKSNKGIYLLGRTLTLSYVGKNVEQFNNHRCLKAVISNSRKEIYMLLEDPSGDIQKNLVLVLNTDFARWSTLQLPGVTDIATHQDGLAILKDGKIFATNDGLFNLVESTPFVLSRFEILTKWINVGNIDGFNRLRRCLLLGDINQAQRVSFDVAYDYKDFDSKDSYDLRLDNKSDKKQFLIKLRQQKCSAVRFRVRGLSACDCSLSGIGIEYGVDPRVGLYKQPAGGDS